MKKLPEEIEDKMTLDRTFIVIKKTSNSEWKPVLVIEGKKSI